MAEAIPKLVTVHSEGGYFNIPGGKDEFGRQDDREAIKKARESNTMGTPYKSAEEAAKGLQTPSLATAPVAPPHPTVAPTDKSLHRDPVQRVRSFDPLIEAAAKKHGINPDWIRGVIYQESGGNPKIRGGSGEVGLGQFMDATWTEMGGGNKEDPATNIDYTAKYLAQNLREFGTMEAATAAYNQGPGTTRASNGKPSNPVTRNHVANVMAATARFSLTASSQTYQSTSPPKTLTQAAQSNLEIRDPRLPVIQQALRIKGKTMDEFANRLKDPAFRSEIYDASMKHAESLDPKLRMIAGEQAYLKVLQEAPSPDGTPGPRAVKPPTPPPAVATERTWLPEVSLSGAWDVAKQTVAGATVDMAKGAIGTAEDIGGWLQKADKKFKDLTGMELISSDISGTIMRKPGEKRVSQSIEEWADETIQKPKSTTTAVTRAAAGFLFPFLKVQKAVRATGAGKIVSGTIASGSVTAVQKPDFSIDDPLVSVAVADFVRELWVDDPAEGQGVIARYIDGTLPEDELFKRLAQRGFRVAEDIAFGGIVDAIIGGFRMIKAARQVDEVAKTHAMKSPEIPSEPTDLGGPSGPRGPDSPPDIPGPLEGRQKLRDAEDRDPLTQLSRDLEIRKQVREAAEIDAELQVIRGSRPPTENALTEAFRVKKESNTLARELAGGPRHPVTDELLDNTPTGPKPSEIAQDKVLTELTTTSNPTRMLARNHNRFMQDLMKSGMTPDQSRAYLTSLDDVVKSAPEVIDMTLAAKMTELEDVVDEVLTKQDNINVPKEGQLPLSVEDGLLPGVARLPMEQVASISSELVDSGGGMLKTFVDKLKEAGLDTLATKAIIAAVLKGSAVGIAANELIDPTSSEAAETGEPEKSDKVFGLVLAAILGVGAIKAVQIGRGLKKTVSNAGSRPMPSDYGVKPGIPTSRIEANRPLTPEELADPMALFEHTNPRFDLIADSTDYRETLQAANDLFKGQPEAARKFWLNTPLNSAQELAEAIGADPKELQALIDRTNTPLLYSDDMKAVYYNSLKAKGQLLNLVLAWHGVPKGTNMVELATRITRLHSVYGQLATGFNLTRSDFGRGLNVPRQASDGRLLTLMNEGPDIGELIRNPESLQQYMNTLLRLLEEPGGAAAVMARKMVTPTFSGAISQAFLHSLLGTVQTAMNTAWSSGYRLILNPLFRTAGSAWQHMDGTYKAGTSPALEEGWGMVGSIVRNFVEGVGVAKKTLLTGETMFLERGTSLGSMSHQSQFVREAFGPIPKIIDSVGGLIGMPNAGNVFNYIGSFLEVIGTRGLLTVDEFTQFLVKNMELDALAIRASKDPLLNFKSVGERHEWVEAWKKNPPKEAMAEVAYQKSAASYMNNLFDHRGGFQGLRTLTGHVENGIKTWPIARIFAPFLKTSVNVLQLTGEMNPLTSWMNAELRNPNPAIRGEAQGRMIVGLGLATAFALWGSEGKVRGVLTNNSAYRSELEKAGVPENSVDWGGRTWKINPREPLGNLLIMFGQLGAAMSGESVSDDEMGMVESLYSHVFNLLKDSTVAGALAELMQDISPQALDQKVKKLGLVGATVDTLDDLLLKPMMPLKQFQDLTVATDGVRRVYDTWWEKFKSRTPWLSDTLAPETDILRRNRWAGSGLSADSVNNSVKMISGVAQDKITQDALSVKLIAKQVHINDPSPTMTYGGVTIPMSKAEQQELRYMIGHPPGAPMSLYEVLKEITDHPEWEGLSSGAGGTAEIVIKNMVQQYTQYARRHMLSRSEDMQKRITEMRKQKNIDGPAEQ